MDEQHIYSSDDKLKWWGYGEWVEEPDVVKFECEGILCEIIRVAKHDGFHEDKTPHIFGGYLCGYISIPKDHLFFNKEEIELDVHCGITFDKQNDENRLIGFDCAHSMDLVPSMAILRKRWNLEYIMPIPEELIDHPWFNPIYRNIAYCIEECKSMALQLKEMENSKHG